jgi:hypothetical protein
MKKTIILKVVEKDLCNIKVIRNTLKIEYKKIINKEIILLYKDKELLKNMLHLWSKKECLMILKK